jgi:ABC-type nitrate/sulfonate/bicarbonate transport system permease component
VTQRTSSPPPVTGAEPPAGRAARRGTAALIPRLVPHLVPIAGIATVAVALEAAPRLGLVPRTSFPPLSAVLTALVRLGRDGDLATAVGATASSWARAMLVASLVAIPLGALLGSSPLATVLLRGPVEFLRPIPSVALIPVLVLIFGPRASLAVTLGAIGATFPLLYQVRYGVADIDPLARDTTRAFGLGRAMRLRWLVLPSVAPYLATGFRLSASVALILVVTGEYVVGIAGVGREVLTSQSGGAYDRMYAFVLVAGLLGLAVTTALRAGERRVLAWHTSQRHEEAPS